MLITGCGFFYSSFTNRLVDLLFFCCQFNMADLTQLRDLRENLTRFRDDLKGDSNLKRRIKWLEKQLKKITNKRKQLVALLESCNCDSVESHLLKEIQTLNVASRSCSQELIHTHSTMTVLTNLLSSIQVDCL